MALGIDINQLVTDFLPAGFTVSQEYIDRQLRVNQLLLHDAAEISDEMMYEIDSWSDEWQVLLAYLVVYDIYTRILSGNIIFGSITAESTGEGSSSIKKIVTGPTEVEFHNDLVSFTAILKSLGGPGGLMEILLGKACGIARKLGVKLPFCPAIQLGIPFIIAKKRSRRSWFDYVTKKPWRHT